MKKTSWLKWICCLSMVSQVAMAESDVNVYGSLGYRHGKQTQEISGYGLDFSRAAVDPTVSGGINELESFKTKHLLFKAGTKACFDNICVTGEAFLGTPFSKGTYTSKEVGDIGAFINDDVRTILPWNDSVKLKQKTYYGLRGSVGYKFFPTDSWIVTPNVGLQFENKSKKFRKKINNDWVDVDSEEMPKATSWGPSVGFDNEWKVNEDVCLNLGLAYVLNYKKGSEKWDFGHTNVGRHYIMGTLTNGRKKVREKGWRICGSGTYKMDETLSLFVEARYENLKGSKKKLPATMKHTLVPDNAQNWNLDTKLKDQSTEVSFGVHYLF